MKVSVHELAAMNRTELAALWLDEFSGPAPRSSQAPLLRSALAWALQADAVGLPRSKLRRNLRPSSGPALAPGTTLVREWQGQMHHVQILDAGFAYSGKVFRSLTAIARTITGTPWSGPLFFGVRR